MAIMSGAVSSDESIWPLMLAGDLFVLVLFAAFMLVRHFNHRDKLIREAAGNLAHAHQKHLTMPHSSRQAREAQDAASILAPMVRHFVPDASYGGLIRWIHDRDNTFLYGGGG